MKNQSLSQRMRKIRRENYPTAILRNSNAGGSVTI
jgi:hypothetical protein